MLLRPSSPQVRASTGARLCLHKPVDLHLRCYRCLSYEHIAVDCRNKEVCWFCRRTGHRRHQCHLLRSLRSQLHAPQQPAAQKISHGRGESSRAQRGASRVRGGGSRGYGDGSRGQRSFVWRRPGTSAPPSSPINQPAHPPPAQHLVAAANDLDHGRPLTLAARRALFNPEAATVLDFLPLLEESRMVEAISVKARPPSAAVEFVWDENGAGFVVKVTLSRSRSFCVRIPVGRPGPGGEGEDEDQEVGLTGECVRSLLFSCFPPEVNTFQPLPLLPEMEACHPLKLLCPSMEMGPPVDPYQLPPSSLQQGPPFTQTLPASSFMLPTPPTCTDPIIPSIPPTRKRTFVPLVPMPFEPVRAPPIPFHDHKCASEPVPQVTALAAGVDTPVLADVRQLLPQNRILTKPEGRLRLRQALYLAGVGERTVGRRGNPLSGGTLDFLGSHGPYMFRMEEGPKPDGLLPKPKVKPKGLLTLGLSPMEEEEVQPTQAQMQIQADALPRDADAIVISDTEELPDLNGPPINDKGKNVITYNRRSERIRLMQDGQRMGSVERASQRKAGNEDSSDSSLGSFSGRRRKSRKLPDINKVAPLPVTQKPEETSRQKLRDLAACCGLTNIDDLLNMTGRDALMNMDLMLKLKGKEKVQGNDGPHG